MTLFKRTDFTVIADSSEDREHWLEQRKSLLSSSDIFTWREVNHPDWWGSNRNEILMEKIFDKGKAFDDYSVVNMMHGSYDERNIAMKFGHAVGAEVQTVNWLVVNPRWEYLGASIDGFVGPPQGEFHPEFFQDPSMALTCVQQMEANGGPMLLEIKKSLSRTWKKGPPTYYADAQVQVQLHILDLPGAVLCGDTVLDVRHYDKARGKPYFRRYWDMRPYYIPRDPAWADILDEVNEEFPLVWSEFEGSR